MDPYAGGKRELKRSREDDRYGYRDREDDRDGHRSRRDDGRHGHRTRRDDDRHRHRTWNDDIRHGLNPHYDNYSRQGGNDEERSRYPGGRILEERNMEGKRTADCKGNEKDEPGELGNKEELFRPSQPEPSLLVATHSKEDPSDCLVLRNVFDAVNTQSKDLTRDDVFGATVNKRNPEIFWDIEDSIQARCAEFGQVEHVHVHEDGSVYVRFSTKRIAMKAQESLHGNLFEGRRITATFMPRDRYIRKFQSKVGSSE